MTRAPWRQIAPRWKTAHRAARAASLSTEQHAVLESVLYLLAGHQVLQDRISLLQIARESGLCDPGSDDQSRHARRLAGRHLGALAEAGAIRYEPRAGKQTAGLVALPEPNPDLFTETEWRAFQDARHEHGDTHHGAQPRTRAIDGGSGDGRAFQDARHEPAEPSHGAREEDKNGAMARAKRTTVPAMARVPGRAYPRVEIPKGSIPEVGAASDGPSPSGAVRSGATSNGAGADPAPPPDGDDLLALARTDPESNWAWDILTALDEQPPWFKDIAVARLRHERPGTVTSAAALIKQVAKEQEVDIRLPKGPKPT